MIKRKNIFICNIGIEERWNDNIFSSQRKSFRMRNVEEISIMISGHDDIVILRQYPNEGYIDDMKRIGFEIPEIIVLNSRENNMDLCQCIVHNEKEILQSLKNQYNIVPYIYEKEIDIFKDKNKFSWLFKSNRIKIFNNKLNSYELMKRKKILTTEYVIIDDVDGAKESYLGLLKKGFQRVVVKMPFGAAGKGAFLINNMNELASIIRIFLRKSSGKILIEGFYENSINFNYQLFISENGKIDVFFISEQIMNGLQYEGSFFGKSLNERLDTNEVKFYAEKVGRVLYDEGIRGVVGVDGIFANNNYYPAIDVNVRFTMSTYLYKVESIIGQDKDFLSMIIDVSSENALDYNKLNDILSRKKLKYDTVEREGIIIYVSGTLPNEKDNNMNCYIGRIYALSVANNFEKCYEYRRLLFELVKKQEGILMCNYE